MPTPGDWATWSAAAIAFVSSFFAVAFSWRSLHWEKAGADAAARSAEAAERANRLTERLLERENIVQPQPGEYQQDVRWTLERRGKYGFVLRNVGTATAEGVSIDEEAAPVMGQGFPRDAVLRPNEGVTFLMVGAFTQPIPSQIYVTWRGHSEPVAVPVPA